jgi:hypothetical protein
MNTNTKAFDESLRILMRAQNLQGAHEIATRTGDLEAQLRIEAEMAAFVPPGLYEHWKSDLVGEGPKFYIVDGAGFEQDYLRPLVLYAALYGSRAGQWTFRHLTHPDFGFLAPISRKEPLYTGVRFALIEPLGAGERLALRKDARLIAQYNSTRDEVLAHVARILGRAGSDSSAHA